MALDTAPPEPVIRCPQTNQEVPMFRPRVTAAVAAFALAGGMTLAAGPASAGNAAWDVSLGGPGFAVSAGGPGYRGAYWARPYAPIVRPYYRPYYYPIVYGAPIVYPARVAHRAPVYVPRRVLVPAPMWGGAYPIY
jgi:hypothetical protein